MGVGGTVQGKGGWHEAMVLVCLPWAAPIGLSPLHIPTHCGSKRVLVVPTEPLGKGGGGGASDLPTTVRPGRSSLQATDPLPPDLS